MPRIARRVTRRAPPRAELSEAFAEGVTVLDWLYRQGQLAELSTRLRVPRQGGYADVDILVFLVLYLCASGSLSIKEFGARAQREGRALAAVAGRRRLPSPSSVSRYLQRVQTEHVEPFITWLLTQGSADQALLQHPAVVTRDTQGEAWHFFDWDATVTALRHRALPQGAALPEPSRRSATLATPGYSGRKRGEVRFSRATLQHAGTGCWVHGALTAERGDTAAQLPPALAALVTQCERAGVSRTRAVVRSDGAGGNVGSITECQRAGLPHLTRLAHYEWLQLPEVRQHLAQAEWVAVPDGASGPGRVATELGEFTLNPGKESRSADGGPLAPLCTRVVVSRLPTAEKVGAGVVLEGWQYELYGTSLPADAWPAAETVQAYYGRSGQENRFGQEDRELALDRIFSYHLPGQALVVGLGLWLWNLRTVHGFQQLAPPHQVPEPTPRTGQPVAVPPLSFAAEPPVPAASTPAASTPAASTPAASTPAASTPAGETPAPAYVAALERLDWEQLLHSLPPDWRRSADGLGLTCPQGTTLFVSAGRPACGAHSARLRWLAPAESCRTCAARLACGARTPGFVKEINRAVPDDLVAALLPQLAQERHRRLRARVPAAAPPQPSHPPRAPATAPPCILSPGAAAGPYAVVGPLLLVTVLRHAVSAACRLVRVSVHLASVSVPPKGHPALASTAGQRQRRRQTWQQREAYNALPENAGVTLQFVIPPGLEYLWGESSDRSRKAA